MTKRTLLVSLGGRVNERSLLRLLGLLLLGLRSSTLSSSFRSRSSFSLGFSSLLGGFGSLSDCERRCMGREEGRKQETRLSSLPILVI